MTQQPILRFLALAAALVTFASFGFALWASHQSITYGLAPPIGYVFLAILAVAGIYVTFTLVRHGLKSPATGETS